MFTTIVIAVISAVITSIATYWAHKLLFGPQLNILFRQDEYGTVKTDELIQRRFVATDSLDGEEQELLPEIRKEAVYVRLRVQNERGLAKGCRGYLTDVEYDKGNGNFQRIFFDSIPLWWSYADSESPPMIDLPKGVDANLDVFSANEGGEFDNLVLRTISQPLRYEGIMKRHGRYRLTVLVAAENAEAKSIRLLVDWNGYRDQIQVEPES